MKRISWGAGMGLLAVCMVLAGCPSGSSRQVTVPDVAGKTQEAASTAVTGEAPAAGRSIAADAVYNAASASVDNAVTLAVRSITVTSPTAGIIWGQGETKTIDWTTTGTMTGNVSIFLMKPGAADKWLGQPLATTGTLSCTMPANQTPGTDYSIKIVWAANNAVYGVSAPFTVEARTTFAVAYPVGNGETWAQGESKTVTWTQVGLTGNVAVYLAKDGLADKWLNQGPFSALQLSCTLPFAVTPGSGYKVKLVSCSNSSVSAVGINALTVTQGVPFEVTYPGASGELWAQGTVKTITWVNHGLTGPIAIFLSKSGIAERWIAQPLATAQSVTVRLPYSSLPAGNGYALKFVYCPNNALTAVGTNTVTVETRSPVTVNYPVGGATQAFVLGTTLRVSWLATGLTTGNMAVFLTKPGMADRWLGQPLAAIGYCNALIPASLAPGNDYGVKVVYTLNNAWTDTSDSPFTIIAAPAVSAPAAGALWTTPSTGNAVTWNMTSLPGNVAVYLTKPGVADRWLAQPQASAGTVNVNIPSGLTVGADYGIRVTWALNNAIAASSAALNLTEPKIVPDVVGQIQSAAQTVLTGAGLTVGTIAEEYSATVPSGSIISQNPTAGASVVPGSAVALTVSKGPQPVPVPVPDVVEQTQAEAEAALTGAGFAVGAVSHQFSATVPAGDVISQDPAAGTTVPPGTAVALTVSDGPEHFFALPKTGPAALEVTFQLSDPIEATKVTAWAWDFENDGIVDSTEAEPKHTYPAAGDYTVALTTTTASGSQTFVQPDYVEVRTPVDTVVNEHVILIDNELYYSFVSKTETELVLNYTGIDPSALAVGDIVVGSQGGGYARIIQAIAQNGSLITLTTTNAALTEIFQNADISCPVQFTPQDMSKAGFKTAGGGSPRLPLDNFELTAGVFLNGSIEFEPRLDLDCRLDPLYLRAAFVGTLAVNLQVDVGVDGAVHTNCGESSILPQKLCRMDLVWVGGWPVIIYSEFDIKVGGELGLDGKASVAAGYCSATTVRFGAEYINDAVHPISGLSLNAERFGPEFYFEAGGYAKVYVKPEGRILIYGVMGPGASITPYLKAELQWTPTRELTLKAGLQTELSFSLVDLEPFGLQFKAGLSTTIDNPVYVLGRWPLEEVGSMPATPAFNASALTGVAPLQVQFTDSSNSGSGTITEWDWDFGDSILTGTQSPQHTYSTPGTYRVSLRVKGTSGQADWAATEVIRVVPSQTKPTANFSAAPTQGGAPLYVRFTDLSTAGSDAITAWAWDFNGDSVIDNTEQNPAHVYSAAGTYSVTLLVTTAAGTNPLTRQGIIRVLPPSDSGTTETVMLPGGVPLEMKWIPGGSFMMGRYPGEQDSSSYDDPRRMVMLGGYWMAKYELTKRQWTAVMNSTPWSGQSDVLADLDSPAVYVTWNDAQSFLTAVNSYTGKTFRLPSEAQREYACRGGTTTRFYWGDDPSYTAIGDYAWYDGNARLAGQQYAHVVGLKLPNAFGLYDMSGNVFEWCEDSPWAYERVLRGGSWVHYGPYCRSAFRSLHHPAFLSPDFGFRVARTP